MTGPDCVACGGTRLNSKGNPCWPCHNKGLFPPQGPLSAMATPAPQHEVKISYKVTMETEPTGSGGIRAEEAPPSPPAKEPPVSGATEPGLPEPVDPYDAMGDF